jgi:hypothetical protein
LLDAWGIVNKKTDKRDELRLLVNSGQPIVAV